MDRRSFARIALAVLLALAVGPRSAAWAEPASAAPDTAAIAAPYPLEVCPVSGEKLHKPVIRTFEGREVRFCCASCAKKFQADLPSGFARLDSLIVAAQKPGYPLEVCLVSGGKLGEMAEPFDYVHENQLVRFCCPSCLDTFKAKPAEYLLKLRQAYEAKQAAKPEAR